MGLVHTAYRVRDAAASLHFYEALGFELRGRLNFDTAYNLYLGLPGDGDRLELTVNLGRQAAYDIGDGYGHIALTVADIDATLGALADEGIHPERPPYTVPGGARIAFVRDPDGYRVELIDGDFATPQDSG